jgi:hypothetical protein
MFGGNNLGDEYLQTESIISLHYFMMAQNEPKHVVL